MTTMTTAAESKTTPAPTASERRKTILEHVVMTGVRLGNREDGRGPGLVADRDFKEGELVVMYADKLTDCQGKTTEEDFEFMFWGQPDRAKSGDEHKGYVGTGAGCFVNDGCSSTTVRGLDKCTTVKDVTRWVEYYNLETTLGIMKGAINVYFHERRHQARVDMVAMCPISKDTPILTSYSEDYWVQKATINTQLKKETRLACLAWRLASKPSLPLLGAIHNQQLWIIYDPQRQFLITDSSPEYVEKCNATVLTKDLVDKVSGLPTRAAQYAMLYDILRQLPEMKKIHAGWLTALGFTAREDNAVDQWVEECKAVGYSAGGDKVQGKEELERHLVDKISRLTLDYRTKS